MIKAAESRTFLAAIDLDGTLFDEAGRVAPSNVAALKSLARHGVVLALASGRHPADMAHIAASLPGVEWIIACQGGEVSDAARRHVLARGFLSADVATRVAETGMRAGFGVVAYSAEGEVAPWAHPEVQRYEGVSKTTVHPLDPACLATEPLFKIMWIADPDRIDALTRSGPPELDGLAVDTVRSHDFVFEFVPPGVSKGSGAAALARHLGIARDAVIAFGDADNDLPLFAWAGRSIAMPHARPHVRARATHVAPVGSRGAAFARGVDALLARGLAHALS